MFAQRRPHAASLQQRFAQLRRKKKMHTKKRQTLIEKEARRKRAWLRCGTTTAIGAAFLHALFAAASNHGRMTFSHATEIDGPLFSVTRGGDFSGEAFISASSNQPMIGASRDATRDASCKCRRPGNSAGSLRWRAPDVSLALRDAAKLQRDAQPAENGFSDEGKPRYARAGDAQEMAGSRPLRADPGRTRGCGIIRPP